MLAVPASGMLIRRQRAKERKAASRLDVLH
jgi:hypothetical protein